MASTTSGEEEYCIALYDYSEGDDDSGGDGILFFREGETMKVLEKSDAWWMGENHEGKQGWFPASYVEICNVPTHRNESSISSSSSFASTTSDGMLWKQYIAQDGRPYYVNTSTQERSWKAPADGQFTPASAGSTAAASGGVSGSGSGGGGGGAIGLAKNALKGVPPKPLKSRPSWQDSNPIPSDDAAGPKSTSAVSKIEEPAAAAAAAAAVAASLKKSLAPSPMKKPASPTTSSLIPQQPLSPTGPAAPSVFPTTAVQESPAHDRSNVENEEPSEPSSSQDTGSKFDPKKLLDSANGPESKQELLEPSRMSFVDYFWGDNDKGQSGFDILVLKHRNGKEVCKDMAEFMRERAAIEDQYAKQLQRLGKLTLGDQEEGSLKTAWMQIKMEMLTQAAAHQSFAQSLSNDVDKTIMKFKDSAKKQRKAYEVTILQDKKGLADRIPNVERAKRNFLDRCKEAQVATSKEDLGQLDHMTKKDFMKVQDEAKKLRQRVEVAVEEYKRSVDEYNLAHKRLEDDMISGAKDFEDAELERVAFLKEQLIKYINLKRSVNDASTKSLEFAADSVNASDALVDIELFIKSKGTGSLRPLPMRLEMPGDEKTSSKR